MTVSRLEKLQGMAAKRPDDPFALYGLAMEYRSAGRQAEAASTFQDLLQHHPQYTAAYLHFGRTLLELGQEAEAERVYRSGIEVCAGTGAEHARSELEEALELMS